MKKYIIFIELVLTFFLSYSAIAFSGVPLDEQKRLWSDLVESKKDPKLSKLDKWNVIEGITLIKKVDDVNLKATALATIIHYYDIKDKIWLGGRDIESASKKWIEKKKLKKDEIEMLSEKSMKHVNELQDELENARKEHKGKYLTYGVNVSRAIDRYVKKNKYDIARAVRDFASKRGMEVDIIVSDNFKFNELMNFVDNKIPFLLQPIGTDDNLVCVGYLKKGTEEYLITSDLNKIMFEEVSHAAFVLGKGEMAKRSREKSKELDKRYGFKKKDMQFELSDNMKEGIEIKSWETGKYFVYVIKDFRITDYSIDKYYRFLMEK